MMFDLLEAEGAWRCPRCGEEVSLFATVGVDGQPMYKVWCANCKNAGPSVPDEHFAIELWNQAQAIGQAQKDMEGSKDGES